MTVMIEVGTGLEKGHFPEAIVTIEIGVKAIVGTGPDQRHVLIKKEYNISVVEYDHLAKDCPTSREEKEIEQLQQMLSLGNEQPHQSL